MSAINPISHSPRAPPSLPGRRRNLATSVGSGCAGEYARIPIKHEGRETTARKHQSTTLGVYQMSNSNSRGVDSRSWLAWFLVIAVVGGFAESARAQSPELAMRDFSSGQIKKGVRSIGFGGDGATWGNYGLVWQDANTAVLDYGNTRFSNGNDFNFQAVGATSPSLWHDLAIYAIAMQQGTNDVKFLAKAQGLGPTAVPMVGKGNDEAVFVKVAMPLAYRLSRASSCHMRHRNLMLRRRAANAR